MSYDTTVRDALEPPLSRVVEARVEARSGAERGGAERGGAERSGAERGGAERGGTVRRASVRWFVQRHAIAMAMVATVSISTLGGVTWTVARLSEPSHPTLANDAVATPLILPQSPADFTTQPHGRQ